MKGEEKPTYRVTMVFLPPIENAEFWLVKTIWQRTSNENGDGVTLSNMNGDGVTLSNKNGDGVTISNKNGDV